MMCYLFARISQNFKIKCDLRANLQGCPKFPSPLPPPLGGIDSSCWVRKSSGEGKKGRGMEEGKDQAVGEENQVGKGKGRGMEEGKGRGIRKGEGGEAKLD